jgi:hypothetical protein
MITINARKYVFTDFVQVLEQIDILERTQFVETTGAWSYYQILKPFLRKTVGKYLLSKLLEKGYMLPDGYNGQLETARIEGDDRLALSQLKAAIYSFRKFNKDFAIHPLYDTMDKPTWEKFHSIHIANHLSFVEIFPIELEFDDNLQDTFFQQGVSTPKILSVSSLSKLEAQDGMIRKRKSKSKTKIKSVVQKRKR